MHSHVFFFIIFSKDNLKSFFTADLHLHTSLIFNIIYLYILQE